MQTAVKIQNMSRSKGHSALYGFYCCLDHHMKTHTSACRTANNARETRDVDYTHSMLFAKYHSLCLHVLLVLQALAVTQVGAGNSEKNKPLCRRVSRARQRRARVGLELQPWGTGFEQVYCSSFSDSSRYIGIRQLRDGYYHVLDCSN